MSAIAGVCNWDGQPVSDFHLTKLSMGSQGAGPDGGGTVRPAPWLALQSFILGFDRLSANERQPYVFGKGSVLTWDGRLDNRNDLLLTLHRDLEDDLTDPALVAAAYSRWGEDMVSRLLGDWSFAIWDNSKSRLLLARDYMGSRPLYYRRTACSLVWATRLEVLVTALDLHTQPDEDYIVGRLLFGVPQDVTPFEHVRSLRAGHMLVGTPDQTFSIRRFWTFSPSTIRYRNSSAYGERLRELITEAVQVRLRSNRPVWSHLSGGWDSSSLVCVAQRLIESRQVEAPGLQPVSLVFTGRWSDCNETAFIEAVERWTRTSSVRIEYGGYPSIASLLGQLLPGTSTHYVLRHLDAPATAAGARVVLAGSFGDQVMLCSTEARSGLFEPVEAGHLFQFLRLCFVRARSMTVPVSDILLGLIHDNYISGLVSPLQRRRHAVRRMLAQDSERPDSTGGFGLTGKTLKKALELELQEPPSVTDFPISKRALVETLYHMADQGPLSRPLAVTQTWPYNHRPLVEFMLSIPTLAAWEAGGPPRAGMRRALTDVLPPEILARGAKKGRGSATARSAREQVDDLGQLGSVAKWQLTTRGYLDPVAVAHALSRYQTEGALHSSFPNSWIQLEVWLQTLERMRAPSSNELSCHAIG